MMTPEERVEMLRKATPDSWIAMSADESRAVGKGMTYQEAVEDAERNGVKDPILIKTPPDWIDRVFVICA